MEMEVECMLTSLPTKTLNGEPSEEVDWFKSTWSRKWQLMEDVRGMWYTE